MNMQEKLRTILREDPRALGVRVKHTQLMQGVRLYAHHKLGDSFEVKTIHALEGFPKAVANEARFYALEQDVMVFRLGFNMDKRHGQTTELIGYVVTEGHYLGKKGAILWKFIDASATKDQKETFEMMLSRVSTFKLYTIPNLKPIEVW